MDEVKKYWRDRVFNLLQWGTALFILFVGWAVSGDYKIFKIASGSKEHITAAVGLLVASLCYVPLLPVAIKYIYRNHLSEGLDKTVLPYGFARTCACILSALPLIVAALMIFI